MNKKSYTINLPASVPRNINECSAKHMILYPNCSVLLMRYVTTELLPHFQDNKKFRENNEIDFWDQEVEYFEGIKKPRDEHDINLVHRFAFWTQNLRETYPGYMGMLFDGVAHENSMSEYAENSTFSVEYGKNMKTKVNLTFTVLVIRAMLLKARPVVAESLKDLSESAVDMRLLNWMEELLSMFPDELHPQLENDHDVSVMSSEPVIHVRMERVDEDALITSTGWWCNPNERVSALFDKTWKFQKWRSFRLACGVQKGINPGPQQLKWIEVENDTTVIDLFKDIPLPTEYNYYLLITKFPDSLADFLQKNEPERERWYTECVNRFGGFLQTHGPVHVVKHVERSKNEEIPEMAGLLAKLGQCI